MVWLAVSSKECIDALALAGFRRAQESASGTLLRRNFVSVNVPHAVVLEPSALAAILRSVHISVLEFLELLEAAPDRRPYGRRASQMRSGAAWSRAGVSRSTPHRGA